MALVHVILNLDLALCRVLVASVQVRVVEDEGDVRNLGESPGFRAWATVRTVEGLGTGRFQAPRLG